MTAVIPSETATTGATELSMVFDEAFLATTAGVTLPKTGAFNLLQRVLAASGAAEKPGGNQADQINGHTGHDAVFEHCMHLIRK
jgi:hypothetical protein